MYTYVCIYIYIYITALPDRASEGRPKAESAPLLRRARPRQTMHGVDMSTIDNDSSVVSSVTIAVRITVTVPVAASVTDF